MDGDVQTEPKPSSNSLPLTHLFDSKDFDAVTWLNSCYSLQSEDVSLQSLAHSVDDSLHEAHLALDRSLARALAAVPWAVRESEKVRQRANTLRGHVDGVGERVAGVEAGVASSVDTIARADDVVRRVEAVSTLLSQASSADRLQSQLEALLSSSGGDSSDLVTAADVLARLRAELQPLAEIPELQERFRALDKADTKLETMAAPQLKSALENRNGPAAANARVVFDRAGRENAFAAQYVAIRTAQVSKLWSRAWENWVQATPGSTSEGAAKASADSKETMVMAKSQRRNARGDISAHGADDVLSSFYGNLQDLLQVEAEWLETVFPDLRYRLIPSLIVTALADLHTPSLRHPNSHSEKSAANARKIPDRMHAAAHHSISASSRVCSTILPSWDDELYADDGFSTLAEEAVSATLAPHRLFLESIPQLHAHAAKTAASAIVLPTEAFFLFKPKAPSKPRPNQPSSSPPIPTPQAPPAPSLNEVARDMETCAEAAVSILDDCLNAIIEQTVGIGITAMTLSASTVARELSKRLLLILKHKHVLGGGGRATDEWARVSGALRLLRHTSTFKRRWDASKEANLASAIGAVTPALEAASLLEQNGTSKARLRRFVEDTEDEAFDLAAVVWELSRDRTLAKTAVSTFENMDTGDFSEVLAASHRVVYETMMAGVRARFVQFGGTNQWNTAPGDELAATMGSSPMPYATEVAEYLMTVPQQLEPFVPDEEDSEHATPKSGSMFSSRPRHLHGKEETEMLNTSFAGMWIHVLAVGTMELYVERICGMAKMSELGARQLAVDTEYMCNVMSALGVNPTDEMALVRKLIESGGERSDFEEILKDIEGNELRKVVKKVAGVRGVKLTL